MNYKEKGMACLKNADYDGYENYSKLQYEKTKSDDDLELYENALKCKKLHEEIKEILALEGKSSYEILGIPENSTLEEIKKKFRLLATKYHPSKTNVKGANDAMRIIQKAYFEINTLEKKNKYDRREDGFLKNLFSGFFASSEQNNIIEVNDSSNDLVHDNANEVSLDLVFFQNIIDLRNLYGESFIANNLFRSRRRNDINNQDQSKYFFKVLIFVFFVLVVTFGGSGSKLN